MIFFLFKVSLILCSKQVVPENKQTNKQNIQSRRQIFTFRFVEKDVRTEGTTPELGKAWLLNNSCTPQMRIMGTHVFMFQGEQHLIK